MSHAVFTDVTLPVKTVGATQGFVGAPRHPEPQPEARAPTPFLDDPLARLAEDLEEVPVAALLAGAIFVVALIARMHGWRGVSSRGADAGEGEGGWGDGGGDGGGG